MSFKPISGYRNSVLIFYFILAVYLLVSSNFYSCKKSEAENKYASLVDSTRYVGMATCKQCHLSIYDSYIKTGMGQSFDKASRLKSSARFDHHPLVTDTVLGYHYFPEWVNDTFYVREFLLNGKDTSYLRKEKVDYIVGSGQHTNSHIRNSNHYLYQIPLTYYTQEGRWDLPPGFSGGFNSRFNRKIELECMTCHNGIPKIVSGSENKYLSVPNGIDCERCHGPGSTHVMLKSSGNIVDTSKYIDYSIVNPSKLPIDLQLDVCQRCHIQGNAVLNEGKSFVDFRPGMPLSSVMNVFMPVYKGSADAHIMASHAERLKMSRCFLVSLSDAENSKNKNTLKPYKNALTCISCHNPHVSVRFAEKDHFNAVCRNCHGADGDSPNDNSSLQKRNSGCSENKEKRMLVSDNCVSCHMRRGGSIDIPHVVTTDHFISKPVSDTTLSQIREFIGLVCINNKSVDSLTRGKAFISYFEKFTSNPAFLDSAKRYLRDSDMEDIRKNFSALVHWAYLKNDFSKVIGYHDKLWGSGGFKGKASLSNSDAWTAYRIGQSFYASGGLSQSLHYFDMAVDLAPYQPDFRNKLASTQHDAGLVEEAKKNYRYLIAENPDYVPAYTSLGFILQTMDHNSDAALNLYDKALSLDPLNEQAMLNKAGLLVYLMQINKAKSILKQLCKLYPDNLQALNLKNELSKLNSRERPN